MPDVMEKMVEAGAPEIYRTWAAAKSVEAASWEELNRLGHSIVELARMEATACIRAALPLLIEEILKVIDQFGEERPFCRPAMADAAAAIQSRFASLRDKQGEKS